MAPTIERVGDRITYRSSIDTAPGKTSLMESRIAPLAPELGDPFGSDRGIFHLIAEERNISVEQAIEDIQALGNGGLIEYSEPSK